MIDDTVWLHIYARMKSSESEAMDLCGCAVDHTCVSAQLLLAAKVRDRGRMVCGRPRCWRAAYWMWSTA